MALSAGSVAEPRRLEAREHVRAVCERRRAVRGVVGPVAGDGGGGVQAPRRPVEPPAAHVHEARRAPDGGVLARAQRRGVRRAEGREGGRGGGFLSLGGRESVARHPTLRVG